MKRAIIEMRSPLQLLSLKAVRKLSNYICYSA